MAREYRSAPGRTAGLTVLLGNEPSNESGRLTGTDACVQTTGVLDVQGVRHGLGWEGRSLASNRFVLLVSVRLQEWFGIQDRKQLPGGVKCLLLAVSSDRK